MNVKYVYLLLNMIMIRDGDGGGSDDNILEKHDTLIYDEVICDDSYCVYDHVIGQNGHGVPIILQLRRASLDRGDGIVSSINDYDDGNGGGMVGYYILTTQSATSIWKCRRRVVAN